MMDEIIGTVAAIEKACVRDLMRVLEKVRLA